MEKKKRLSWKLYRDQMSENICVRVWEREGELTCSLRSAGREEERVLREKEEPQREEAIAGAETSRALNMAGF